MNKIIRLCSLLLATSIFAVTHQPITNKGEIVPTISSSIEGEMREQENRFLQQRGLQQYLHNEYIKDFFRAAKEGDLTTIKHRLRGDREHAPIDVNMDDPALFNTSVLMYAAMYGHPKLVRYLINHGADINKSNRSNQTALFLAVKYNHPSVVKVLLQNSLIKVNEMSLYDNSLSYGRTTQWKTPLKLAAEEGYKDIADMLRAAGATE